MIMTAFTNMIDHNHQYHHHGHWPEHTLTDEWTHTHTHALVYKQLDNKLYNIMSLNEGLLKWLNVCRQTVFCNGISRNPDEQTVGMGLADWGVGQRLCYLG